MELTVPRTPQQMVIKENSFMLEVGYKDEHHLKKSLIRLQKKHNETRTYMQSNYEQCEDEPMLITRML